MPSKPISPISPTISAGKRWARSRSWTPGRTRSSAKRRTCSRSSSWSSLSPKLGPPAPVAAGVARAAATPATGAGAEGEMAGGIRARAPRRSGLVEHPVGDHHLLDLAGALVDLGDTGVAEVALDVVLARVAVAAVDLQRLVGDPLRHLGREELGLRGLERVALPLVPGPGRLPGQQARGVELGRHVGEIELDGLEVGEVLAELLALLGVGEGVLERRLGDTHGLR